MSPSYARRHVFLFFYFFYFFYSCTLTADLTAGDTVLMYNPALRGFLFFSFFLFLFFFLFGKLGEAGVKKKIIPCKEFLDI